MRVPTTYFCTSGMKIKVEDLRNEYKGEFLDVSNVDASPFTQFEKWFQQALDAEILEPNAMVVSTCNAAGQPSSRTVLLKQFSSEGFVFFTNYESRKAKEIDTNPNVSLLFPWYDLSRQVIIHGETSKISEAASAKYFLTRPFGSQLGAWVSVQSSVISSRSILEKKWEEMKSRFQQGKVPLPDRWGGYKVKPRYFEFWQGQPSRLHDRIVYRANNDDWHIERLAP